MTETEADITANLEDYGVYSEGALTLDHTASEEYGFHRLEDAPDTEGYAEAQGYMWRDLRRQATALGRAVAVYASHNDGRRWLLAVVEPDPI